MKSGLRMSIQPLYAILGGRQGVGCIYFPPDPFPPYPVQKSPPQASTLIPTWFYFLPSPPKNPISHLSSHNKTHPDPFLPPKVHAPPHSSLGLCQGPPGASSLVGVLGHSQHTPYAGAGERTGAIQGVVQGFVATGGVGMWGEFRTKNEVSPGHTMNVRRPAQKPLGRGDSRKVHFSGGNLVREGEL